MSHLKLSTPHLFSTLCPVVSFCIKNHLLSNEISLYVRLNEINTENVKRYVNHFNYHVY